jgi:hypothetical protein
MTPARQERKSGRLPAISMAFLGFVVDFLGPEPPAGVRAGTAELIVANRYTGVAINGFDPVAYFVDTVPRLVRADLEWRYEGVT